MLTKIDKQKTIVLDTSAFIAGFEPLSIQDIQYSVPEVEHELITDSLPWTRFIAALENGKLKVKTPRADYVKRIKASSKAVGDLLFLSDADQQVLALALELKDMGYNPQIVTDDYSIQNVANQVGIKFTPLLTFGIRYRFRWTLYCPACHHKYPADYQHKRCEICGTELKRKPVGKTPL
ncbi:MAG: ribonuclease VapC [Candidatus Bathyarchaeota archaeon]|nr:ribonuclease VapC [Candidatus Bathyarchaeota archaeon]